MTGNVRPAEHLLCCALVALLVLAVDRAGAQERRGIVFGHGQAAGSAQHRALLWAGERIRERTAGRFRLEVLPEARLGVSARDVTDGFASGLVDMAFLGLGDLLEPCPSLAVGGGPFVFRDFEHWQRFAGSSVFAGEIAGLECTLGLRAFGLVYHGARHVVTREPLPEGEALADRVIGVPNVATMVRTARALGARPVPIPLEDSYQALRDGIVDAQDSALQSVEAMRFHEVAPVINETAHILDGRVIVMREGFWRDVDPVDRSALAAVFAKTAERITGAVRQRELELPDVLVSRGAERNAVDREALIGMFRPLRHSDCFPWGGQLYDRIQALAGR